MPTYLITNRLPEGFTGSAEALAAWTAWFEGLGDHLADRGDPAFTRTAVGNCGLGTVLGGYTLVTAEGIAEAASLAADHPLLSRGGGVEIAELTALNMGRRPIIEPRAQTTAPGTVEVSVHIAATPGTVFPYLTDPARYVQWMGSQATLEAGPGGDYRVQMPDGFAAAGTFTEVEPPHRLAFTWGWADDDAAQHVLHGRTDDTGSAALPPGSTRVEVMLATGDDGGTRLTLRHHDLPTSDLCDAHLVAWETYLRRLAIRVAGGDPGPEPHS
jgi:uncharacterized protein YndB with AHSA1/START domain